MRRIAGLLVVVFLVWASAPVCAQTIRDIENAWKNRESNPRSGRIEWTERVLHTKISIGSEPGRKSYLPEDVTVTSKKALTWTFNNAAARVVERTDQRILPGRLSS